MRILGYELTFQGLLDKAFIFFMGFSASGWLTFMVAFAANIVSLDPVVRSVSFLFVPWYIAACGGPVFYVLAGIYFLLKDFKIGRLFGGAVSYTEIFDSSAFVGIIYMAALSAPMFSIATLLAGAIGAVQDFVDIIDVADDVDRAIDLGPFDFFDDALVELIRLFVSFIEAIIYFVLIFFFERFITAIRGQFVGSFTAMFFMVLAMMTWPFYQSNKERSNKKLC